MESIKENTLARIDLGKAIEAEASHYQSLLPPAPGWENLVAQSGKGVNWLKAQLRKGYVTSPQQIVSARKFGHGVRPVPIWRASERVIYRALVDKILENHPKMDRSSDAYKEFLWAPVNHARTRMGGFGFPLFDKDEPDVRYVVKTDITAFYQYIDHAVLADELIAQTGEYDLVYHLTYLLKEVQGRTYGLPQLSEPSDRLSEVYIDIVEREMIRKGWAIWRYNDDFRIFVESYGDALYVIEELDSTARSVGLTISESKTTTPRFKRYMEDVFAHNFEAESPENMGLLEPDMDVADYTEDADAAREQWALEITMRCHVVGDSKSELGDSSIDFNLPNLKGEEFRKLRRAFNVLSRAENPLIINKVVDFMVYVPALTPWIMRYVTSVAPHEIDAALVSLDKIRTKVTMSDWQRIWLIRTLADLDLLADEAVGNPKAAWEWVRSLLSGQHSPAVQAEAILALAGVDKVSFKEVEHGLRWQPSAVSAWYLNALRILNDHGSVEKSKFASIQNAGGLDRAYLAEVSG